MDTYNFVAKLIYDVLALLVHCTVTIFGSLQGDLRRDASKADVYSHWLAIQTELDSLSLADEWRQHDYDRDYDWHRLRRHVLELEKLQKAGNSQGLSHYVRFHASRNECRILTPSLYRKSAVKTKLLIERYIRDLRSAIIYLGTAETRPLGPGFTPGEKFQVFNDVRQTLGRTSLVLQGGSAFSMCHLGVVRALYKRRLLPRIITGVGTGAIVAALVAIHPEKELLEQLAAQKINLSAFANAKAEREKGRNDKAWYESQVISTIIRRFDRFMKTGHVFDSSVLERCVRDNLGEDVTFEEAYRRTGRILNITVALPNAIGIPQLFNYITTPNVIIWSAVMGSIATSKLYTNVNIWCKTADGGRQPYFASASIPLKSRKRNGQPLEAPLQRIGELFNVNHFIVSQTRPYVIPFIWLENPGSGVWGMLKWWLRWIVHEAFHFLVTLNDLGWTFQWVERLLIDELIPAGTSWSKIVLTPELQLFDIFTIFNIPDAETLERWILRGERSVWPAVCELQIRCGVEFELDKAYEGVKRRNHSYLSNGVPDAELDEEINPESDSTV